MDDNAFFERAILASAAEPDDEDAVRQLRELFAPEELAAWEWYKASEPRITVPVEHDDENDRYVAEWGEFGIQGTSPASYEAALDALAAHVRAWAGDVRDAGPRLGTTAELRSLVDELDELDDEALRTFLLVRVSFDRGGLTFGLAEFVEEDGSTTQRAVPFADGRPPAEIDLPVDGVMTTYQSSVRGGLVAFSRVGAGPSIAATLRQEEPTGDVGAEFPQPGFGPSSSEA
ncbi:hypothetical protein [Leifsonia shinshuensis]|uniref:hypothetical protein n=1 Tax=Leifsonia shinshuensis TaxID=150026 RepID=UPI0028670487|nr:hypothetical protein [Leifsonia shinshuensis]MDR6972369.1 hypothetical protein [Leifsonia shinshuensis]